MWGIFFEDINFGADGGLYAELVKNRSFEFPMPMMGWKEVKYNATGKVLVVNAEKENPANPRYAQIRAEASQGGYGISNEGFRGIGIQANTSYVFSMRGRKTAGEPSVQVQLYSSLGKISDRHSVSNLRQFQVLKSFPITGLYHKSFRRLWEKRSGNKADHFFFAE